MSGVRGSAPQTRAGGMSLYVAPDPVQVATIWHTDGYQAVAERWDWKMCHDLHEIQNAGLALLEQQTEAA